MDINELKLIFYKKRTRLKKMKLLVSIDVGLKNLAIAVFDVEEKPVKLYKWDVLNICSSEDMVPVGDEKMCNQKLKKRVLPDCCGKKAKYQKNNTHYYCSQHAKKCEYRMPVEECKQSVIKKKKLGELYAIAENNSIPHVKPSTKMVLGETIIEYFKTICLEPIEDVDQKPKPKTALLNLVVLGKNLMRRLDVFFADVMSSIVHVVIENQISPIANRMKTLQGMISQYFIMRCENPSIHFISSANKLKDFSSTSTDEEETKKMDEQTGEGEGEGEGKKEISYSDRKQMGIEKCRQMIIASFSNDNKKWVEHFESHKKKDDLADSFLQGMWFITTKKL